MKTILIYCVLMPMQSCYSLLCRHCVHLVFITVLAAKSALDARATDHIAIFVHSSIIDEI